MCYSCYNVIFKHTEPFTGYNIEFLLYVCLDFSCHVVFGQISYCTLTNDLISCKQLFVFTQPIVV